MKGDVVLAPAPRPVARSLRLRLHFGGILNVMGWILTGFGLIFVWVFVGQSELGTLGKFPADAPRVTGFVRSIEATSMHENDRTIQRVAFEFEVDGVRHEGVSYTPHSLPRPGAPVEVEYAPGEPAIARIRGMRTAPFPMAVAFVWIFPLVGLGLIAFGWRGGQRAVRLLRDGVLARGRLVDKQATNTRVNNQRVYALTFEFEDDAGETRRAVARTHRVDLLEDESTEALVYDRHTEAAALLDALPGRPVIDADGGFTTRNPATTVAVLIAPTLTVVGHGTAYVLVRVLGA